MTLHSTEKETGETLSVTLDVGWGGKIINTSPVGNGGKFGDWHGITNLTGTESDAAVKGGAFNTIDIIQGSKAILEEISNKVVDTPTTTNHSLPTTVFTRAGSYDKDHIGLLRPTSVTELPEKLLKANRESAHAFSALSVNFEVKQGEPMSRAIFGKDIFSLFRMPRLYCAPSISPEISEKYGRYFTLKAIQDVSQLRHSEKITFPVDWGIWQHKNVEQFLPLLALLTCTAPKVLTNDTSIIINEGFGNDPSNPEFMNLKLDFVRAFQELTGKFWHFATNPISRTVKIKGLVFVDPIFEKGRILTPTTIMEAGINSDLGNQSSNTRKVLLLLQGFVAQNQANNYINDPNMQLLALRAEVAKIVG